LTEAEERYKAIEHLLGGSWDYFICEVFEPKSGWPPIEDVLDWIGEGKMMAVHAWPDEYLATVPLWDWVKAKWKWHVVHGFWRTRLTNWWRYRSDGDYRARVDDFGERMEKLMWEHLDETAVDD